MFQALQCVCLNEVRRLCTLNAPKHGRNVTLHRIMVAENIAAMPAQWTDEELQGLQADFPNMLDVYDSIPSKYNPRPGTRRHD